MRFLKLFTFLLTLAVCQTMVAQNTGRYLSPQFNEVTVTTVQYGTNFTFLPIIAGARPRRQPLVARIYTPVGDAETARPLIIYLKTGNFFPFPANGSCGGALNDSSNVEFATRLAKLGYVVAVADYRAGWIPTAADPVTGPIVRRSTLINAAYRGVQDVRTCIRYFRRNVAESGNQFGVDPSKIVVWGQGTGGYLSMASAYLNTYNEILTTSDPLKYTIPSPNGPIPMILEAYNGNIYGTSPMTIADATYEAISGGIFKAGDTLSVPNHVGYSSDFNLVVNMGGALGDSTWLDDGEMPLISFHVLTDEFAPCGTDVLNVPTINGPLPVVEVSGSCAMQPYAEAYGNNDIFKTIAPSSDPYGANSTSGLVGFYPFEGTPDDTSSPWEWTNPAGVPPPAPTADCNVDASIARTYIDTIIGYYAPRGCVALGLNCNITLSAKNLYGFEVGLQVSPVPATDVVNISAKELIRQIYVYDLNGRLVKALTAIDQLNFQLQRTGLQNGLYIAEIRFDQGTAKQRIIFTN